MTLEGVVKTKRDGPYRALIYGPHKIGKSTWANCSPKPIFIQTEDGLHNIEAESFGLCETLQDVTNCIKRLAQDEHDYETVVLDTADWLEKIIHINVADSNDVDTVANVGYGKGYVEAANKYNFILSGLQTLYTKGMNVIILAHTEIKTFHDPMTESYDRYQIKLRENVAETLQEWVDVIGFAQEEFKLKEEKQAYGKRHRPKSKGKRVLRLSGGASFDAGNRYNLPEKLPLNYTEFAAAMDAVKEKNDG